MHKRILFTALICLAVQGISYPQQSKKRTVKGSYRNELVSRILQDIKKQAGVLFEGDILNSSLRVSVKLQHCTVEEALTKILAPIGYQWNRQDIMYSITYTGPWYETVSGIIKNEQQQTLDNINITIEGTTQAVRSNSDGAFELHNVPGQAVLIFTSVNTETLTMPLEGKNILEITLRSKVDSLMDVVVSNGIETIDTNKFPAYSTTNLSVNGAKLTTGKLALTATGLLSVKDKLLIRTTSTILGNQKPLIILDDAPFDEDVNEILPEEIESITILKDALATAVWGARAGNGAIVIKRKKSRFKKTRQVQFSSGFYVTPKKNLYKDHSFLPSAAFIEVEKFLFNNGYYDQALQDLRTPVSPVAQILYDQKMGLLSDALVRFKLDSLSRIDVRDDLSKYFYRSDLSQLYSLSVSGADAVNAYYIFLGYNGSTTGFTGNKQQQYILHLDNILHLIKNKLDLVTGFRTSVHKNQDNNTGELPGIYPYTKLAGDNGEALTVQKENKDSYLATADVTRLYNWQYKPLDELKFANNTTDILHFIADMELRYIFNKNLWMNARYRMERRTMNNNDLRSIATFYTRNMINKFTQVNGTSVSYAIPPGDILNQTTGNYRNDNLGLHLYFSKKWDTSARQPQILNMILGADVKITDLKTHEERSYGYDDRLKTKGTPNYNYLYPIFGTATSQQIPYLNRTLLQNDNFMSGYLTASYAYRDQFFVSGSLRQDAANAFERAANSPLSPFWSLGLSWDLSQALFYKGKLECLRLRVTNGTTGNTFTQVSGRQVILFATDVKTNLLVAVPVSPPDADIHWERSKILNAGIDIVTKNRWLDLSLDLYNRNSTDLIANTHIDRTTGYSDMITNSAKMNGKGVELNLRLSKKWGQHTGWEGGLGFNYAKDNVTKYLGSPSPVGDYFIPGKPTPLQGHSLNALYSLRTMGLGSNGQLLGVYKGSGSRDYSTVLASTDLAGNLVDEGSAIPLFFGIVNNSFRWNDLTLSASISYKLGWYFRRPSVNYNDLFNNRIGHTDLLLRWKQSGDEAKTFVPAMIYPADKSENTYYSVSELLVAKGDNIRLQDITVGYTFNKKDPWLPFKKLSLYASAANLGFLWRANKYGLDPDYPDGFSQPPTFAFGLTVLF